MVLSQSCEYAVRAVVYIASKKEDQYVSIGDISGELNISFHFLTKILQKLSKIGLLDSYRGPKGGIKLAKNAEDISVIDIVSCIDGLKLFSNCILGLADCDERHPCPLHDSWAGHRREISRDFEKLSIKDLVELTNKYSRRMAVVT